jgi:hypothetical protein
VLPDISPDCKEMKKLEENVWGVHHKKKLSDKKSRMAHRKNEIIFSRYAN